MNLELPELLPIETLGHSGAARDRARSRTRKAIALLHTGAFAIGAMAIVGFVADSASIAGIFHGGRPVAAITGVAMILLAIAAELRQSGHAIRSKWGTVFAWITGAWALLETSESLIGWSPPAIASPVEAVPLSPYPVTSLMLLLLATVTITSSHQRPKMFSHILGSAILLSCVVFVFGVVYQVPWFVNEEIRLFPVLGTTVAFVLLSAASLLEGRVGWVAVVLSDTSVAHLSRLLLPGTIVIPLLTAIAVHGASDSNYLSKGELTVVVAVNTFCITALILAGGALIMKGESERRRLAAIVQSSADAIYACSVEGTLLSWNRAAEKIYGYSAAEALGMNASILSPPDRITTEETLVRRALHGERLEAFETIRRRKDGSSAEVSLTFSAILDEKGAIDGIAVIGRDIGAQNAAARALRASEARFRSLTEANILGIIFWRRDGTIADANDEFLRLTGYSRAEIEKGVVSWSTITPPEAREDGDRKLAEALSIGWLAPFEKECLRADGERVPVIFGAAVGPEPQGIAFLLDITDRKRAEQLQKQLTGDLERAVADQITELQKRAVALENTTTKLARSNRELEAFTYSVSHDLRAPLRAMDGFSRILMEEYGERLDERAGDYVARIRKATDRMSHLIDDLLSLSRVTRQDLQVTAVDLTSMVRSIAEDLQVSDPERRVTWAIAEGVRAEGDAALLQIALQNLIGNAWKFTSKKSDARIEFGYAGSTGEYFVRDDGAGFDPRHSDKLFVPFQRLHSMSEFEGTGIGLALVERIIHRHEGRVRAEGATGEGATFWFSLGNGQGAEKC